MKLLTDREQKRFGEYCAWQAKTELELFERYKKLPGAFDSVISHMEIKWKAYSRVARDLLP